MVKFLPAASPPTHQFSEIVVLTRNKNTGREAVFGAYYFNNYPLEMEECECAEEHEDGCPHTGWFVQCGGEYDTCYERLTNVDVIAYMLLPTAEQARSMMEGPW